MKLGYRYFNGQYQFRSELPIHGKGSSCLVRNCLGVPLDMRAAIREVCAVSTPEECWGLGLATNLMNSVCREADSHNKILLLTIDEPGRERLTKFYEKFGFSVIDNDKYFMMIRNPHAAEVVLNVG